VLEPAQTRDASVYGGAVGKPGPLHTTAAGHIWRRQGQPRRPIRPRSWDIQNERHRDVRVYGHVVRVAP